MDHVGPSLSYRRRWLYDYRLHACLAAVVVAECAMAYVLHRTDAELTSDLRTGSPSQKVFAFYVLTNRPNPPRLAPDFVRSLLA